MQNVLLYPLQEKQEIFSECTATYRLFGGAKGGGKSYAMRAEVVKQALSRPFVRGLVLRRTYTEITENMVVPLMMELPGQAYRYNSSDHLMTFYNGSTVRFSYCRNLKDVLQYQGIQYDFICIEELTHWTEHEFQVIVTCLRPGMAGVIPNFFASSNPGGPGHGWVKRLFVDRKFQGSENPSDYAYIPSKVWDNPILLARDPSYLQKLTNLPEVERRAFLEGDWNVFIGQYFKDWRDDIHVVDPFIPLIGVKKRIISFDYGFAAPSAVLWIAQMNTGEAIAYRELYVTEHTYKMLGVKIKALTTADEKIDKIICDPAIVGKRSEDSGNTGKKQFAEVGVKVHGGNNARVDGWQTVRGYLQPKEDPNGGGVFAHLKVTSNCKNLIETLPALVHDATNVEDVNTKGEDHAPDALRYGLVELGKVTSTFKDVKAENAIFAKQPAHTMKATSTATLQKPKIYSDDSDSQYLRRSYDD